MVRISEYVSKGFILFGTKLLVHKHKSIYKLQIHFLVHILLSFLLQYKLSKEELLQKTLQLTIWNHDRLGKNDCLGEVQLNMKKYANTNKLNIEQSVWYTLQAPVRIRNKCTAMYSFPCFCFREWDKNIVPCFCWKFLKK